MESINEQMLKKMKMNGLVPVSYTHLQDLVFGGQNMIAENGSMLAESRRFENGIIYSEIDVQRLADERRRMSTYPAVSTLSLIHI